MANSPIIFHFTYSELLINEKMVESFIGYAESNPAPEPVSESARDVIQIAESLCNIRGGYVISDNITLDHDNKRIYSHENWFETKQIVTHQLRRSEKAAWFVCTAGEEISAYSKKLMMEGDTVKGYVADVLANVVVEAAMDRIQLFLKTEMESRGLKITNRYSPGYCGWDISEQKKLFMFFPDNFLNISLSESSLMIPVKSVSGIIGIGKEVKFNDYTCNLCSDKGCIYRRRGA